MVHQSEFALPELPQIHGGFQNHNNLILEHRSNFGQKKYISRFANFAKVNTTKVAMTHEHPKAQ
jgi:hypothetical protein